jgi:hypothetical protein
MPRPGNREIIQREEKDMEREFEAKRVIITRFKVSGPDLRSIMGKVMAAKQDAKDGGSMLDDLLLSGYDVQDAVTSVNRVPD